MRALRYAWVLHWTLLLRIYLKPKKMKRTLIIYNTGETTPEEAQHLLEILNCDDSTLWDNADHCGVQVFEVPTFKTK
jgi:hypothetical protein